jgi:hypothetical protein
MRFFPQLKSKNFRITSRQTTSYNCIAYAGGANDDWWDIADGYTWPGLIRSRYVLAVISVFGQQGYTPCGMDASLEPGWEKVAIYSKGDRYTHAARQLESGNWTSKLGKSQDIIHRSLDDLFGPIYGELACVMKRQRTP